MRHDVIAKISNLKAYYVERFRTRIREIKAVDSVSFNIYKNEILGIAGESGCGKTTLLKTLYGFVTPPLTVREGSIHYFFDEKSEVSILDLSEKELKSIWWRYISFIPQASMSVLNPTMRIKDHFLDILRAHRGKVDEKRVREEIISHLSELGLPREVYNSYPHQLSGGMRQRVVIGLATFLRPKVILADEPTTALDVVVQRGILQLLAKLQKSMRSTLVLVTHDMGIHAQITDRLLIMYAGKVLEIGKTDDVFEDPLHPYTKLLIQSLPRIGDRNPRGGIPGKPPSLENPPSGCRFHPRCPRAMKICKTIEPAMVEVGHDRYIACHLYGDGA